MGGGEGPGEGTCLIFVCRCANAASEAVPFLLQFFLKKKRHPFSCNFLDAVFLADSAKMYPFMNKIGEMWRVTLKTFKNFCRVIHSLLKNTPFLLHFHPKNKPFLLYFLSSKSHPLMLAHSRKLDYYMVCFVLACITCSLHP